jgi:hypothetical protein
MDGMQQAQDQAATLKAARHDRWVDRFFFPALLCVLLAFGLVWYVFIYSPSIGPCFDASRLDPVWTGQTAAGHPAAEFQVPENNWAVVHMDGFYQVLPPGRSFGLNQGVFICSSPDEASIRASKLNASLQETP